MAGWKSIVDLVARVRKWRVPGEMAVKIGLGILLVVLLALIFPRAESLKLEYKLGAVWAQKDLITPFSFPILREEKDYAKEVEEAKQRVYEVFERDTQAIARYGERLERFITRLNEALDLRAQARRTSRLHHPRAPEDSSRFSRAAASLDIPFTEKEWDVLSSLAAGNGLNELRDLLLATGKGFLATGIIDRPRNSIARGEIAVRQGTVEEIVPLGRVLDQNDIVALLARKLETSYGSQAGPMGVAYKI